MSGTATPDPHRVIAYVDGFNLYYGIRSKGWSRYRWLDVHALVAGFIRPPQELRQVLFFTARSTTPADRYRRHTTYLNALQRGTGVRVMEGTMQSRRRSCPRCGHAWNRNQEKQTDVSMAVAMMTAALDDHADEFFLLSADSDLVPVVRMVQERFGIQVTVLDPPGRHSTELAEAATRRLHIARPKLAQAQLPDPVVYRHRGRGRSIHRPGEWNPRDDQPSTGDIDG